MPLPFGIDEFFAVFAAYNTAIWPAQIAAYVLAFVALALSWNGSRRGSRIAAGILALFWIWMGVAYHILYFSPVNPAALVFGVLFVLQGALFLVTGAARGKLAFEFAARPEPIAGAALIAYAMVIYPLIGAAFGHHYPAAPTFGVAPCPTTIFTFGLLLWSTVRVPRHLLVIPVLWAAVGTTAAIKLGVPEDYGLALAAIVGIVLLVRRDRMHRIPAPRAAS